jgi:hypothetical protein
MVSPDGARLGEINDQTFNVWLIRGSVRSGVPVPVSVPVPEYPGGSDRIQKQRQKPEISGGLPRRAPDSSLKEVCDRDGDTTNIAL